MLSSFFDDDLCLPQAVEGLYIKPLVCEPAIVVLDMGVRPVLAGWDVLNVNADHLQIAETSILHRKSHQTDCKKNYTFEHH